jgi:hypothetical protein
MRRTEDKASVGWTARVPALHKQALESILSATSGKTWFVRTGLQQFNDECEKGSASQAAALQAAVTESILAMRGEEPPRFLEDFIVRVPVAEYVRFNAMFPDKGATTWFMRRLIAKYIEQAEDRPTPDVHVLEAVRGILKL